MRPAELLAIAAPAARTPATEARPAEDAAAFARALGEALDRGGGRADDARRSDGTSTPKPYPDAPDGGRDGVAGFLGERPRLAAGLDRAGWRPAGLDGLATAEGVDRWLEGVKARLGVALDRSPAAGAGDGEAAAPLMAALDALGEAMKAALADPAAAQTPAGQLPAPVQAALNAAVAAAPPVLAGQMQAFAARFTDRFSAALTHAAATAGEGADEGAPSAEAAAKAPASAVLAALDGAGEQPALAAPTPPAREARERPAADLKPAPAKADAAPSPPSPSAEPSARAAAAKSPPAPAEPAAETPPAAGEALLAAAAVETDAALAEAPAAPSAQAAAETRAHALAAVRGSPEIAAQLASVIARRLEARTTRFDMELNPAELGRVDVRLRIDADGRVAAQLAFDNPLAAAEMRGRADELRRQLAEAGFQVSGEDLTFEDKSAGSGGERRRSGDDVAVRGDRESAFRDGDRNARLAEDAGRLQARTVLGLDMRV